MFCFVLLQVIFMFLTSASGRTLPSYIKKCSLSDPLLNQCFLDRVIEFVPKFKDGVNELGVVKYEPFYAEKLDFGKIGTLHQVYDHIYVHGLSKLQISNLKTNLSDTNCFVEYDAFIPQVIFEANYKMNGKLLLFSINAAGKCRNIFEDTDTHHLYKCEKYMKKGKKYIKIVNYKLSMTPKKIKYNFENLLEGSNSQVESEILKTVNENAVSVFNDFKPAFEKTFEQIFIELGNNVYSRFAEDELFLP